MSASISTTGTAVRKPLLMFSQIISLNLGFSGIQCSFCLQQSAVNSICNYPGPAPDRRFGNTVAFPIKTLLWTLEKFRFHS
jgi:hypothetical protein